MIRNHCTGDVDEMYGIRNTTDETSKQNGALFHVTKFVKYDIGAGSISMFLASSELMTRKVS